MLVRADGRCQSTLPLGVARQRNSSVRAGSGPPAHHESVLWANANA